MAVTKMVVRRVKRVEAERSYLQVAGVHCTKMRVWQEDAPKPIELLMFSDAPVPIAEMGLPPAAEGGGGEQAVG